MARRRCSTKAKDTLLAILRLTICRPLRRLLKTLWGLNSFGDRRPYKGRGQDSKDKNVKAKLNFNITHDSFFLEKGSHHAKRR